MIPTKECKGCSILFSSKDKRRTYCSSECSYGRQRIGNYIVISCMSCSILFERRVGILMGKAKVGNYRYFCSRVCHSNYFSEERHPKWVEDRSKVGKRSLTRDTLKMKKWRIYIFERDTYKCQLCRKGGVLNAHHIKPLSKFPDEMYNVENGITLCEPCHKLTYCKELLYENLFDYILEANHEFTLSPKH